MKQPLFYKILILTALFAGCQKIDLGEPVDGTPVFSAKMLVNNEQKQWTAGVDDYYMFTEFEKGQDNVYTFSGRLQKENCQSNCGESLTIRLRDFQQLVQGNPDIANALKTGFYSYKGTLLDTAIVVSPTDTIYRVSFDATSSVGPPNSNNVYQWNFGNGSVTGQQVVNHDFQDLNPNTSVTLTLMSSVTNCSSSQTRRISLSDDCAVHILYNSNALTELTAVASGTGPFTYQWSNGAASPTVPVQNTGTPSSVTLTNSMGCTASASVNAQFNPVSMPPYCSARFSYQVQVIPVLDSSLVIIPNPYQFSTVTIEYRDAAGTLFGIDQNQVSPNSWFEIIAVEDFDDNENGEKTKKLTVRFACRLINANGAMVELKSGEAVIAVAWPG